MRGTEISKKDWWQDHVIGGLMTYWIYQHLGNLSPEVIKAEGLLDSLLEVADGEHRLHEWALRSEELTSGPGHYRFSFVRDIGRVRLVMIDSRKGRVLEPGKRRIVDDEEWEWIVTPVTTDVDHLLIGTSLPVFVPIGLHDLQVWSEPICDGAWGRLGRQVRRVAPCRRPTWRTGRVHPSFDELAALLATSASVAVDAPATISVLSGDIHFSFAAEIQFPTGPSASRVHQLVSSPIRNSLIGPERMAMRLGTLGFARSIGRALRRASAGAAGMSWQIDLGPGVRQLPRPVVIRRTVGDAAGAAGASYDDDALPFRRGVRVDLVAGSRLTEQATTT